MTDVIRTVDGVRVEAGDTDAEALDRVVRLAVAAAPAVAAAGAERRLGWLERIADRIDDARADLRRAASAETGIPESRLDGELDRTVRQLRFLGAEGVRAIGDEVVDEGFRRRTRPIGPVAVYAAGNFPFAFSVAGTDTASALAAGCPVVVKAHPGHPVTSATTAELVAEALADSGAPAGTFAMVRGFDAGVRLVAQPGIRAAAFTGSQSGGRALFDAAVGRPDPIPFYGELGSVNPVVITRAALRKRRTEIADGFVDSFLLGMGQLCTKPGVVFVPEGHGLEPEIRRALRARTPGPLLSSSIAELFEARLEAAASVAAPVTPPGSPGTVLQTDLATFRSTPRLADEIFGPAALLVTLPDDEDAVVALSSVQGALTATIHAEPEDAGLARRLVEVGTGMAGRIVWNGWPTGVSVIRAMQHGGPWPASTSPLHTSVGAFAVDRFRVPVVYQGVPDELVPVG